MPPTPEQDAMVERVFRLSTYAKLIGHLATNPEQNTRFEILEAIGSPQTSGGSSLQRLNHLVSVGILRTYGENPIRYKLDEDILIALKDTVGILVEQLDNVLDGLEDLRI